MTVCSPTDRGGLGIHNLSKFSKALRLRWLWLAWHHPDRPRAGTELPCDQRDMALFAAATTVTLGDGETASFWNSSWLTSPPLAELFPNLFKRSRGKKRSVAAALQNDTWVQDLRHRGYEDIAQNFLLMWRAIRGANTQLQAGAQDSIRWLLDASGQYSASSAYKSQFEEVQLTDNKTLFWTAWAPGKVKFFCWLLFQNRLWCNDRLQRRGWENGYFCRMCMRSLESSVHLFWECPMSKEIWRRAALLPGCTGLTSATEGP